MVSRYDGERRTGEAYLHHSMEGPMVAVGPNGRYLLCVEDAGGIVR